MTHMKLQQKSKMTVFGLSIIFEHEAKGSPWDVQRFLSEVAMAERLFRDVIEDQNEKYSFKPFSDSDNA